MAGYQKGLNSVNIMDGSEMEESKEVLICDHCRKSHYRISASFDIWVILILAKVFVWHLTIPASE